MHQNNRHILWEPGDHPSVELLRQYHDNTLPHSLHHQLERHLLDCDLCSDVLEGMAISDAGKTAAAVKSINKLVAARTKQQKRRPVTTVSIAAAILVLLCSTVLVFYYNYRELKQEQSIAATETALQEAMKPAYEPVADSEESIAEAAPDTVRPKLIVASPSQSRPRYTPPVVVADREAEVVEDVLVQEDAKPDTLFLNPIKLADAPAIAKTTAPTEAVKSLGYQSRNTLVPESTSVERALVGKAAGIRIRGINSVAIKQVQGQVLSSDGQPLPGVAVTIKGTNSGVATDSNGNFTISLPQDNTTLAFSFIGFEREEKSIDASTQNLTVNLKEDTRALSEVVVTGYAKTTAPPPAIVAARPAAGIRAYKKYLEENIRYTSNSKKGRVVVQATVGATGELQDLKVVKSLCTSCDQEALRLIKEGPAWKPSTSNGSAKAQQVKITVRFKP
ncbi:TonB family protein [Pontibacter sp. H249]|uniref:TonB family protein n=1 Tax=Pontibacter sp. H249 TaxID=3133420 RepID=UPI0030BE87EC